jgi:hypothetical protein
MAARQREHATDHRVSSFVIGSLALARDLHGLIVAPRHCRCTETIFATDPLPPLISSLPHGALLLFLSFKECLLDLIVDADEPFFGMSGTVPKVIRLCLKFACSFLGCPQVARKTMREIHGSVTVCLRHISSLLHQGNDATSSVIRYDSAIRGRTRQPKLVSRLSGRASLGSL